MKINRYYHQLGGEYLFAEIARRVSAHVARYPNMPLYRLGVGDVVQPLHKDVVGAMVNACNELSDLVTFRGYGEYSGYPLVKARIAEYYDAKGVNLDTQDIFVTDGAKSVLNLVLSLMDNVTVGIPNPVYPVYVDSNVWRGNSIVYMQGNKDNGFVSMPNQRVDLLYICNPSNPTGTVYNKTQLQEIVNCANDNGTLVLYDAAYEAFVSEESIPSSIYQVQGAERCAIEICSLSKTAGLSGVRAGYTIVPSHLQGDLHNMFERLLATATNGVSCVSQMAAYASLSQSVKEYNKINTNMYLHNAQLIRDALHAKGIWHCGGQHSPYVWLQVPQGMSGWQYFDKLLEIGVVGTPGEGFGTQGEGYFRLSAFASTQDVHQAMDLVVSTQ
jgi:LL-diaminopimelate aminotransferase